MSGAIAASIRSPSWLQSHDIICISSISKATDMEACGEEAKREKWLVVAKVKFVLIAPPGWKFQFSPRFVKLFIKAVALLASMRVHDVTQLKTHRRMIMMIYMTSHFPWNRLLTREATCGRVVSR